MQLLRIARWPLTVSRLSNQERFPNLGGLILSAGRLRLGSLDLVLRLPGLTTESIPCRRWRPTRYLIRKRLLRLAVKVLETLEGQPGRLAVDPFALNRRALGC